MNVMHPFGRPLANDWHQRRIVLKTLYREVAKRVHPDLTLDEADRSRRQRLMADANEAFEIGDANWLTRILDESHISAEPAEDPRPASDLMRLIRKITLKTRLQATFLERFDDDQMKSDRSLLAENLLANAPHDKIQQDVMNFFEEMHLFLHDCYLEEELVWGTFGCSAVRWWAVCEDYITGQRQRRNDQTLFAGFQELALRFARRDAAVGFKSPTLGDLLVFLEDERKLA